MGGSIMLFVMSGICFAMAIIMFVAAFIYGKQNHGVNTRKLWILKSKMIIHTEEQIGEYFQTMGMHGE